MFTNNYRKMNSSTVYGMFTIRRKLCTGRQAIVNRVVVRKGIDLSQFNKGVKQGVILACIRCPNAQESS